jgi:hypothetical protein
MISVPQVGAYPVGGLMQPWNPPFRNSLLGLIAQFLAARLKNDPAVLLIQELRGDSV